MTSQLIISQNVVINGRVTDFSTKTAISNIHVFTSDLKSGTVSDNNGNFRISLSPDYSNKRLCFSGIGYQTDSVDIEKIRNIFDVKLIPDIYQLKEVFIMPDSTLLTLLRKAYHKISDNYPDQPTMYESFYRESIQNEHKKQVDFVEAVLSVYKDPYDKPTSLPGQVRINKSRKKQARDIGVLYIGGPFLPIEGDVVLTRNKFINPYFFKDYRYEFNGVKVQGRYEYYEILYESLRKENDSGLILIERNSLAYASFHLKKKSIPFLSRMKNAEIEENVIYEEKDGKWFLKYYTYSNVHTDKLNNNPRYATIEYIAINIKTDSVMPIPYEDRLGFADPIVKKASEYGKNGWVDYNILENDKCFSGFQFTKDESAAIFKEKTASGIKIRKSLFSFLTKMSFGVGLSYRNTTVKSTSCDIIFKPDPDLAAFTLKKQINKTSACYLLQASVGYRLNRNLQIYWQGSEDFFNNQISTVENGIGIEYKKNIKKTGLPLFIEVSALFSANRYFVDLGVYDNPSVFYLKEKKFDADKLLFSYGTLEKTIAPRIAFSQKIGKLGEIKLYGTYHFTMASKDKLKIKEKRGGLFKKATSLDYNDSNISFGNGVDPWGSLCIGNFQTGIIFTLF